MRSDILPILELGGKAVYIPYEFTWAHEHIDEQEISHEMAITSWKAFRSFQVLSVNWYRVNNIR